MQSKANAVEQYISELPEERRKAITKLRETILEKDTTDFEWSDISWKKIKKVWTRKSLVSNILTLFTNVNLILQRYINWHY